MYHEDKPFSQADFDGSQYGDPLLRRLIDVAVPGNFHHAGSGWLAALWPVWTQILATLPSLGEVLIVTGNAAAILGERRPYPEFRFEEHLFTGSSSGGLLDAALIPWMTAEIVCQRHDCGHFSHAIEFRDEANSVLHKICLTEKSDRDRFVHWFDEHQAVPGIAANFPTPFPPSRWRSVQHRHTLPFEEVEELPGHALEGILSFAIKRNAPVRIIVGNEGMIQSADCFPKCLHTRRDWLFACDDHVGVHFAPDRLTETIIHEIPAGEDHSPAITVKSFCDDGILRLAIAAPRFHPEPEWQDFLTAALRNL